MASAAMPVEHDRSHAQRRRSGNIVLHTGILLICALTIFPFLWMLSTAFKPADEVFTKDLRLIANNPTLQNFPDAFDYFPVAQWLWNSFGIAVITTAGKVADQPACRVRLRPPPLPGRQAAVRNGAGDDDRARHRDGGPELHPRLRSGLDEHLDRGDRAVASRHRLLRLPAAPEHPAAAAGLARRRPYRWREHLQAAGPDRHPQRETCHRGRHDPRLPRHVEPVPVAAAGAQRLRVEDDRDRHAVLHRTTPNRPRCGAR